MPNIQQITPFLWTQDVPAAIRFFVEGLGFRCEYQDPAYAYVSRDSAALRICEASQTPGEWAPGTGSFRYYIDCVDVDQILAEIVPRLEALDHPRVHGKVVHGPLNQPYGQREIIILAPDGDLLVFGQPIAKAAV